MSILYRISENGIRDNLHVTEHIKDNSDPQDFYVENGAWSGTYHNGEIFIHYTKKTLSGYKIDNSEHLGEK